MFNYDQPEVQQVLAQTQLQLTKSQENAANLMNAVKIIQDGAWVGQGAMAFLEDATTLKTEIDAMHEALSTFINNLGQASALADESMAKLRQLIAAL